MIATCRTHFRQPQGLLSRQALGGVQDEWPATVGAKPAVVESATLGGAWRQVQKSVEFATLRAILVHSLLLRSASTPSSFSAVKQVL